MNSSQKAGNMENYKNFGLALLGIFVVMICTLFASAIGYVGFLDGSADGQGTTAYEAGKSVGRSVHHFYHFYMKNGLVFGNLIAIVASLEKNRSVRWAVLHGILGWGYVIYYTFTRKSVHVEL